MTGVDLATGAIWSDASESFTELGEAWSQMGATPSR